MEQLKLPLIAGSYFAKLQEPFVRNITSTNKSVRETYSEIVEHALLNLQTQVNKKESKKRMKFKQKCPLL